MNRRTFLMGATAASASAFGANDRINVAIVGLGGRGTDHTREYLKQAGCRIAAICDVNSAQVERVETLIQRESGQKPKTYDDMRRVFDDKEIDAVSIVTPNHWHALAGIWACQAGKDVYGEKPACHNIWEGARMVDAVRDHKRIFQVGMQSRSIAHKREAIEALHSGAIGTVYLAKGLCYKRRPSIGRTPDAPVPAGLDWDKFLGPAPMRPYSKNRHVYNWHWFWETGNGDIGNQGVHEMDIARWGLNKKTPPTNVYSYGGKFAYDDDQETPNTQTAVFDYGDSQLVFEVRGLLTGSEGELPTDGSNSIGNLFFGTEGYMMLDVHGYKIFKGEKKELVKDVKFREPKQWDTGPHIANFLAACRSRNNAELNGSIVDGVMSADLCHLANISYRTGRKLSFDPRAMQFVNDSEANRLVSRNYRAPYTVPAQP